ncbi:MAG: hypothetical protein HQK91_09730 [Nitrospirae bacterium]|nr:hypothetical protein [Nitrospirota bacterium]MBF0541713.1 hypothetical protein [Nitrospirota bacterium]
MILDFPVNNEIREFINNYDLFLMPNGIYKAKTVRADNYLYPMYFYKDGDTFVVSTSVYALINYKGRFIRNPKFQTTTYARATYLTIDKEINRVRTTPRRSSLEIIDKDVIVDLGVKLIQKYITEIETLYPDRVHIVLMGGKDSQNIVLAKRKSKWIVFSSYPNAPLNEKYILDNKIEIERFVSVSNDTENSLLKQEIMASDLYYNITHFRWTKALKDLVSEYNGKAILWLGTDGDGIFKKNANHREKDYYARHELGVGMSMGIQHQVIKNILNIPVISPYQSPAFLDELFFKFDPYFVRKHLETRHEIGEKFLGRPVIYPEENPEPEMWDRNRTIALPSYINQLKNEGISCHTDPLRSYIIKSKEEFFSIISKYSEKRVTKTQKFFYNIRDSLSKVIPQFRIKHYRTDEKEIK